MPHEQLLYFADQAHVPYGPRPYRDIQAFVEGITRFFLSHNAKAVVIACNAASAAALHHMRRLYPELPFVGMEPAVKPAAQRTRSGAIGVITTKATYQGRLFASVIDRFAQGVRVETQVCPSFVTLVEAGDLHSEHARQTAQNYLTPLLEKNIDQLVLGCTHFPFLMPLLREVVGEGISIVDPSPAIARQLARVIQAQKNPSHREGHITYFTTGKVSHFHSLTERLLGRRIPLADVHAMRWVGGKLHKAEPSGA
jgi:glutamate racemase